MKDARRALGILLALSGTSFALACNRPASNSSQPTDPSASAASSAAASASGSAAVAEGPCAAAAKQLCDAAGAKSPNCEAFNLLKEVLAPEACTAQNKFFAHTATQLVNARKDCTKLVEQLCAQLEAETCKMVTDATTRFPPQQCTEMLTKFDKVLAELKGEEAKNKPVTGELLAAMHATDAPSFGPADAKVTVVEFSDFQCPYCSRAAEVAKQIKEKYTQVRFVFRQFPLSFHKDAHKASEAALAANAQGKFWEFHDKVFANQKEGVGVDKLKAYAAEVGLNTAAMNAAIDGTEYASAVEADIALGNKVFVQGTPTIFVNGKRVQNPSFAGVSQMIDEELKN